MAAITLPPMKGMYEIYLAEDNPTVSVEALHNMNYSYNAQAIIQKHGMPLLFFTLEEKFFKASTGRDIWPRRGAGWVVKDPCGREVRHVGGYTLAESSARAMEEIWCLGFDYALEVSHG